MNQAAQAPKSRTQTKRSRRRQQRAESLPASMRQFLTPDVWKQARHAARDHQVRQRPRWPIPAVLVVLATMTWCVGDTEAERFVAARAFYVRAYNPKRRRPGQQVGSYHKALAALPLPVLWAVSDAVRHQIARRLLPAMELGGFVPLGCDGTRQECPRTEALERDLGQASKDGSAPMIGITALVSLRTGVLWAWRLGTAKTGERQHLVDLLEFLPRAALLVCDAGYVGYELTKTLLQRRCSFLIRMSSQAKLFSEELVELRRFREGLVYYWPKEAQDQNQPPLRVRLIRIKSPKRKHDVWLLTDVLDARRLSVRRAERLYRMRWESEGFFRSYKRTIKDIKLFSAAVPQLVREAEGSLLSCQLLLAQGALALQQRSGPADGSMDPEKCSARRVLVEIRREVAACVPPRPKLSFRKRLEQAGRDRRLRTRPKVRKEHPQRRPHKPPRPPVVKVLDCGQQQRLADHRACGQVI
jgi:Transposase DDE domain